MPEGPEVRCRRDILIRYLKNWTLKYFESNKFSRYGEKIINVDRKLMDIKTHGKLTYFIFDNLMIRIHYNMEGNLIFEKKKHSNLCFYFVKGNFNLILYFDDTRHFGSVKIVDHPDKLGPDAFYIEEEDLEKILVSRKQVCQILLDQSLISGIGNYLKSEILFDAKIHPERIGSDISTEESKTLFVSMKKIVNASYFAGGCSLKTYKDSLGIPGKYELKIYGIGIRKIFKDKRVSFFSEIQT